MPTSVRLDAKTERIVTLARKRGQTKSEVIRAALVAFAETEEGSKRPATAFESLSHLIGAAKGGPADLSERTGETFAALLRARTCR
jgi:Arc/MetJ-type ribon-helix-helix transcriptional regulator